MHILNLKVFKREMEELENVIEQELEPAYMNNFGDIKNYYLDNIGSFFSDFIMVAITLKKNEAGIVISIVAGSAKHDDFKLIKREPEKKACHNILERIKQWFPEINDQLLIEILDDETVSGFGI